MRRVQLAEIKASWRAWLSVSVVFIAINAALCITATLYWTGHVAVREGRIEWFDSVYYTASQGINAVFILLVALPVINSVTGLVVDSRRGALARLALAGASPRQVRSTITTQLVVVTLASAVIGAAITVIAARPWLIFTANMSDEGFIFLEPVLSPIPIVATTLACTLIAVVAGYRQANAASRIPPVEALRLSQAPPTRPRLKASGWVKTVLLALVIVISWLSVSIQVAHPYKETVSNLFILSLAQIFLWGALLSVIAPVLVIPMTRFWTHLVPSKSPSWLLARATVSARADRLYKSVVPIMFTFVLGVGALSVDETGMRTLKLALGLDDIEQANIWFYAYIFGLPLIIAFSAGVVSLIMMGRQRDAELALVGVVGATPKQRIWAPIFEAVIITGSALLLSLIAIVPSLAFQAYALVSMEFEWTLVVPWAVGACILSGGMVITALATVLPTIPASRLPEPRVIARLVAE
ncbi:MAG: FtsX-like permease family protein [Ancrocorticia sp.]